MSSRKETMAEARSRIVRIDKETHKVLHEISRADRLPMREILARAIEEYRRIRFLKEANAAYAGLRRNVRQWKQEAEERSLWDATLGDGE